MMGDLQPMDRVDGIRYLNEVSFPLKTISRTLHRGIARPSVKVGDECLPLGELKQRRASRLEHCSDGLLVVESRDGNQDVCCALFPNRWISPFGNDVHFGHVPVNS